MIISWSPGKLSISIFVDIALDWCLIMMNVFIQYIHQTPTVIGKLFSNARLELVGPKLALPCISLRLKRFQNSLSLFLTDF